MYLKDLALNSLQWLICHKTKPYLYNNRNTNKMMINKEIIKRIGCFLLFDFD